MYLETSTVVWACEKQQQNGIVWRKNAVYYITFTSETITYTFGLFYTESC